MQDFPSMPKEDDKNSQSTNHYFTRVLDSMSKFRNMVNDCIRIGLQNNVTSLKTL